MTVLELLNAILARYPGATPDAMASFKPVYYARFQKREGPHLATAFNECCAAFKPTARQPFPIPADIEAHMPSLDRREKGEKPLDLKGHRERYDRLLWNWQQAQGDRVSKGILEVKRALEFIAAPIAYLRAWADNPEPLMLGEDQCRLAWQRAISQKRRDLHGMPGKDPDEWWSQVEEIGRQWGVRLKREDWTATTKRAEAA